jgi:DNA-binding GntR family transcriptional regulator
MIVTGQIAPMTYLRERELCESLGISRTPLRGAIRTLAREGLVKILPNRGAVVTQLDIEEVEALFQVVGHIEALAVRIACERAADEEITEITVQHHRMMICYVQRQLQDYLALNRLIHRKLVEASRNRVLVEMWEMLAPRVRRARSLASTNPERWSAAVAEHEAMMAALRVRDGEALGALMEPHYLNGLAVIKAAARDGE